MDKTAARRPGEGNPNPPSWAAQGRACSSASGGAGRALASPPVAGSQSDPLLASFPHIHRNHSSITATLWPPRVALGPPACWAGRG
eukprot:CAMPEP_0173441908 /NCGR_PEP_ID=MMETSP1357-20121228/24248_1 /TAXON_ID=77926 /ORGANISM="Hemiselmis rufescens, Strain PCC563" /LENGTH=85 /DNA_ID=CAMNT_0014407521 /DNA_START=250 /DNA_END=504 /DNA_ORIENTATION=+